VTLPLLSLIPAWLIVVGTYTWHVINHATPAFFGIEGIS
jgi:hypothetical protein